MCTELYKVTTCDDTTLISSRPKHPTINITQNYKWIISDVQAHFEPLPIPIINVEL